MPTQIQLRRGNTAQTSTFTGAAGELTIDTEKKVVVVHDGITAGGFPAATTDSWVRGQANSSFIHANSSFIHANAAFIAANTPSVHANSAFIHANAAFNIANGVTTVNTEADYASAVRIRFTADSLDFFNPDITGGLAEPPLTLIAGVPYAFDVNDASWQTLTFLGGLRLRTNQNASGGSWLANVTHISTTGTVTQNTTASAGYKSGTLYWTPPRSLVGNTTLVVDDGTYTAKYAPIRITDASYITPSFNHANSAFIHANSSFIHANAAFIAANTPSVHANSAFIHANAAFTAANSAGGGADTWARGQANSSFIHANSAFIHANAAFTAANSSGGGADTWARAQANAAFNFANTVYANVAFPALNYVVSVGSEIMTWGALSGYSSDQGGVYGNGTLDQVSSPTQLVFGYGWSSLSETGLNCVFGIKNDGTLWGWGVNSLGELGDNTTIRRSSPTQIGTLGGWKKVKNRQATLALKHDGSLWSWGWDQSYGMLGTAEVTGRSSPVQIGANNVQTSFTWADFAMTDATIAGIKNDGTLWTWGDNYSGELGRSVATSTRVSSPVQVGANTSWKAISAISGNGSGGSFYALAAEGQLWSWGNNNFGTLGINTQGAFTERSSPTLVGSTHNWASVVSQGRGEVHAIKQDGTLWGWGNNFDGKLGVGNQVHRSSPTQVGTRTDWTKVFALSLAVRKDGTLWKWGAGTHGWLGNNTTGDARSSPIQLFSGPNRSPGGWRPIVCVIDASSSAALYVLKWSNQGIASYQDDRLSSNNEIMAIGG